MNIDDMKLYGLAAAAIPDRKNPNILHITFNPISLTGGKRESIEYVHEKDCEPFKDDIDIKNPKSVIDFIIKSIKTVHVLVNKNKASAYEYGLKEVPKVVLDIGEDSRNPIDKDDLLAPFFQQITAPISPNFVTLDDQVEIKHMLVENALANIGETKLSGDADKIKIAEDQYKQLLALFKPMEELMQQQPELVEKAREHDAEELRKIDRQIDKNNWRSVMMAEISELLTSDPAYKQKYEEAMHSVKECMDECTLQWREFTPDKVVRANNSTLPRPSVGDKNLLELKRRWLSDNDQNALDQLLDMARNKGRANGHRANSSIAIFTQQPPSEVEAAVANDASLKDTYASWYFQTWDPAIRLAMDEGFQEAFTRDDMFKFGWKVPGDKPLPFFIDPAMDGIGYEFRKAQGIQMKDYYWDKPDWRERLTQAASGEQPTGWSRVDPTPREKYNGPEIIRRQLDRQKPPDSTES